MKKSVGDKMAVIEDENFAGLFIELTARNGALNDFSMEVSLEEKVVCRDHCTSKQKERAKEEDIITWDMALNEGFRCYLYGEKLSKKLVAT